MTGPPPNFGNGPSLAPSGVIQNPGVGSIIGQGFTQLAQFLAQKQQAETEAAQRQQQLDLQRKAQEFQMAQAEAQRQAALQQQAEAARQAGVFGGAVQQLATKPNAINVPSGGLDMGGPTVAVQQPLPTLSDVAKKIGPQDFAKFVESPVYKAWMETQKAQREGTEVIGIGDQPVQKYGGAKVGPSLKSTPQLPSKTEVVLGRMGLDVNVTGPQLAQMGRLKEFNDLMTKENKETTTQPAADKAQSAFAQQYGGTTGKNLADLAGPMQVHASSLPVLDQMRTILKSAEGMNAGALGPVYQSLGQAAVSLGLATPEEASKVQNTQFYGNLVAKMMGATAKDFASRGLTAADIGFVQDANAANKKWTIPALLQAVEFQARLVRRIGADYNEQTDKIPAEDVNPNIARLNKVDLTGGMPRSMHFQVNGQDVIGTLDDRTGTYRGLVNGVLSTLTPKGP